jgi:hypothetical protein
MTGLKNLAASGPVNSGEKPNNLRILTDRPYIHDRLARPFDSAKT